MVDLRKNSKIKGIKNTKIKDINLKKKISFVGEPILSEEQLDEYRENDKIKKANALARKKGAQEKKKMTIKQKCETKLVNGEEKITLLGRILAEYVTFIVEQKN